jgi:hypothetical protein
MNFPDTLQGELLDEVADGLPAVAIVGPGVVKIEQNAAIGSLSDVGHKFAIREIVRPRPQVICARLDRDWRGHAARKGANGVRGGFHTSPGLARGQ